MKECPACKRCFPDEVNHCPQDGDATTPSLLGEPILDARYQLERRLGQGGMGVVFQARHIFLKTSHAIKVILPDLVGNDPMLVTRFRQEALAAAAIRHQNIIAVTDFGVVRGTMPFLVMEFVSGKSLQDILAEERVMSPARALEFTCAIGAGVGAAHRQNIVHRDLKPLNIMTQEGQPVSEGLKILDFGLAKIKSGELLGSFVQAKTSGLMGSPFYMAPEQWSDDEPDARADVYSLGIILYQMLAGDVPFKGSSIPSIMKKHLTLPPPTLKSMGVDVAPGIEAVVRHALEKEVEQRTPSVEIFLKELKEAVAAAGATAKMVQETRSVDPADTIVSPAFSAESQKQFTSETQVEAGPVSTEDAQKAAAAREAYEREQKEKERVAREELEREAAARRKAAEEEKRKREEEELRRREEEERLRKDREEREARERQQREQMERVERQAKELEERLARLATSMPPAAAVVDTEATQVHQELNTQVISNNSFPGAAPGVHATHGSSFAVTIPPDAKKRSNSLLLIGAAVVLFVVVAGAIGGYLLIKSTAKPAGGGSGLPTPAPTATPKRPKADLVAIPGGTFKMGRNNGPLQETPEHQVTVQPFLMDRTEVTNEEYAEFVRESHHAPPDDWNGTKPTYGTELWPVLNVSIDDVNAFTVWRSRRDGVSYRLPTEQEWEYAARNGDSSDLYPWGNEWKDNPALLKTATPGKVASYPQGNNKWGVADLIGNVWEWTSSKTSAYPGNRTQISESSKNWVVIRGAGYDRDPFDREYPVSACIRSFVPAESKIPQLGFRLVRSGQ